LIAAAALLLAAGAVASPADREYRAALDLLYDGQAAAAQARLHELEESHPDDPVPAYLQALALAWIVEQQPETTARDRELELEQAADRAWKAADARLRADPEDARALFARGAASGVRSRHHLFRAQRADAARTAAQMRDDLEGRRRLARARRAREAGNGEEAAARAQEALAAWPEAREAALIVAERELHEGGAARTHPRGRRGPRGRAPLAGAVVAPAARAPGRRQGRAGDRRQTIQRSIYTPCRRADLREAAADGLRNAFRPEVPRVAPSAPARDKRTSILAAPGAGFLDVSRFSTAASTG
jgi:hypothetical protein